MNESRKYYIFRGTTYHKIDEKEETAYYVLIYWDSKNNTANFQIRNEEGVSVLGNTVYTVFLKNE